MVLGYHCVARIYCASWRVNPTTNHPVPDRVKPSFVIFDIRAERQSARMSKITNDGLTRSGTGCFIAVPIWQQWVSKG